MNQLKDKTCIITGAGTGIGKGIARAFAREGARLVIASRNSTNLDATAEEVRGTGATVLVVPTDVTEESQVVSLFERTMGEFGRLDILVNNSGIFDGGPLEELSVETWRRVLDVNLTGAFLGTREAMKIMKKQRSGRIINIGSTSGQVPRMNSAPYTASKHGMIGLTKSTALEGRAFGISAGCLHPGNVVKDGGGGSPMSQGGEPMMTPDEVATMVLAIAALPQHVNMLEAIILPTEQPYVGRG